MTTPIRRKPKRRLRIVKNGHPVLRMTAQKVAVIDETIRQLAEKMIVSMKENDIPGCGLAAPQVGIAKRLIVVDTRSDEPPPPDQRSQGEITLEPQMPIAFVNPEIIAASNETVTAAEGCLSLPGVSGDVTRPAEVVLKAYLLDGSEVMLPCRNLLGRCLQHEIDHLDGILFIDHAPKAQQKAAEPVMRQLAKAEQKYIPKALLHERTATVPTPPTAE